MNTKTKQNTRYGLFYKDRGNLTGPLYGMVFNTCPTDLDVKIYQSVVKKILNVRKLRVV